MKTRFLAILATSFCYTSLHASGFNSFASLKFSASATDYHLDKPRILAPDFRPHRVFAKELGNIQISF